MNKYFFPIVLLLVFVLSGCSAQANQPTNTHPVDPSKPAFSGLNRDGLGDYSSTFTMQFEGPSPWTYQLKTRISANLREIRLHIEGIKASENPGDIRLVTDGKTSWMIGPGTDQECVQFPNNQGMDPTGIYPESLIPPQELASLLQYTGEETVAGATTLHYSGSARMAGGWQNVLVESWQEKTSQALLKFTLQANGNDQIFNAGAGTLTARYEAAGLGSAPIEPVKGCEISVPLPDSAQNFVRLPGLASFDSDAEVGEIQNFYQSSLPQENWTENEPPAQSDGATILSYRKDAEGVEIHIEVDPAGGCKVKLIFMQAQ
jgi:outer membrane lipoprotein-sorting protein